MIFFSCCRGHYIDLGIKMNGNAMNTSAPSRFSFVDYTRGDSGGSSSISPTVSDMVFNWIQKYTKL